MRESGLTFQRNLGSPKKEINRPLLVSIEDLKAKRGMSRETLEPIKDPARFPWHEACLPRRADLRRRQVKKVEHYYLSVDALTQPMQVREEATPYK